MELEKCFKIATHIFNLSSMCSDVYVCHVLEGQMLCHPVLPSLLQLAVALQLVSSKERGEKLGQGLVKLKCNITCKRKMKNMQNASCKLEPC